MRLQAIGFGSLNLDEFWEVDGQFFREFELKPGEEFVKDLNWFNKIYPILEQVGVRKAIDPGGSAANTIAALARMGFETGFYGVIGKNDAELIRLGELGKAENLRIRRVGMPSGRCLSLINKDDAEKDRALVILPNANDLAGETSDISYFSRAEFVHFSSFVSRGPLLAQAKLGQELPESTKITFDPGSIYCSMGIDAILTILKRTYILFITIDELKKLTGESSLQAGTAVLQDLGIRLIIIKMGPDGLGAAFADRFVHQPAVVPNQLKDRTGAGDVANAGFLAGLLSSLDLEESLQLAATAASRSIEGYGRTSYPDKTFLDQEIEKIKSKSYSIIP